MYVYTIFELFFGFFLFFYVVSVSEICVRVSTEEKHRCVNYVCVCSTHSENSELIRILEAEAAAVIFLSITKYFVYKINNIQDTRRGYFVYGNTLEINDKTISNQTERLVFVCF